MKSGVIIAVVADVEVYPEEPLETPPQTTTNMFVSFPPLSSESLSTLEHYHNGVFDVRPALQICYFKFFSFLVACMHTTCVCPLYPSSVGVHSGVASERGSR